MSASNGPDVTIAIEPAPTSMPVATAAKRKEGDIIAEDYSKVQVGDTYYGHHNIFEMGTDEEKTKARKARVALLQSLAYDGMDLKKSQLAAVRTTKASFEWINHTLYPRWLANPKAKPLWIQGKPASGKSMLMKHLAESRETYDRLVAFVPSSHNGTVAGYAPVSARNTHAKLDETDQIRSGSFLDRQWQVLHFYFDYRIGVSLANTIIGMMKHFLWQLCCNVSAVAQDLIENPNLLNDADVESYVTVLSYVIIKHRLFACAFIDGLDEYAGDLSDLCSHIEDLGSRSGIKLCLASRPDNPLTAALLDMGCEVILMQEHNLPAIRISINHKLSRFEASSPHSAGWFPDSLRQTIAMRAEGIFLWASLVVDLMTFHVKSNDEPGTDLEAFLFSFPRGLEELYNRILGKIKPQNQSDAALLLYLLLEYEIALPGQECSPVILFQAWNYIGSSMSGGRRGPPEVPVDLYQARLNDILGNLLDFFLDGTAVRLLHKTLKEFLDHSQWMQQCLKEAVRQELPDCVWTRLTGYIFCQLEATPIEEGFKLSEYIAKLLADAAIQSSHEMRNRIEHNKSLLRYIHRHVRIHYIEQLPNLKPWSALITFCLKSFYSFYNTPVGLLKTSNPKLYNANPDNATIFLHIADCPTCLPVTDQISWIVSRLHSGLSSEIFSMAAANAHGISWWSQEDLARSMKQVKSLGHRMMEDAFDIFLWSCLEKTRISRGTEDVLRAFANEGYVIGGRHFCELRWFAKFERLLQTLKGTDTLGYWYGHELTFAEQICHDRDCPEGSVLPNPAHHWLYNTAIKDVTEDKKQFRLLINIGISIDACFETEGGALRAILEQLSVDKDIRKATTKFLALSQSPRRLNVNDLHYVEELQRRALSRTTSSKTTMWKFPRREIIRSDSYTIFLSRLAEVLRELYISGTWDQEILRVMEQSP